MTLSDLQIMPAMPEIFMAVAAMVLLVLGVASSPRGNGLVYGLTIASLVAAAVLLIRQPWDGATVLNGFFVLDRFAAYMKLLVLGGLAAVLLLSRRYLQEEQMSRFEYPILILLAGLGMMLMLSASHLLTLYVGLELQSLSLYVLAAIRRDDVKSSEAGLKYFILGALASGMLLFGISLIYGYVGSLSFAAIATALSSGVLIGPVLVVGLVFLLIGIAFKISAVPFHMWTPDVYEGAPTSVTALFAIVPKAAAMGLLIRLLIGPFGPAVIEWQQVVWFLSIASMVWSSFAALGQTNIKRLMAYSSIGNMGYALMGVVAASAAGISSVMLYITIYMIMSAGTFGIILAMRRNGRALENLSDLAGLSRTCPLMAYALAILMFSMSGIPPLAGFFGKLFVFQAAVASGHFILAVIGVLSSVVAAYYYLKIIKIMFFDEPAPAFDRTADNGMRFVVAASILFILFFIFSPSLLLSFGAQAAQALFPS